MKEIDILNKENESNQQIMYYYLNFIKISIANALCSGCSTTNLIF